MAFLDAAAEGRLLALGFFDSVHALALGTGIAPVPSGPCPTQEGDHHDRASGGM